MCRESAPTTQEVKDSVRVETVIQKVRKKKANHYGVNPNLIEHLYREMIEIFITMELNEFKQKNSGE